MNRTVVLTVIGLFVVALALRLAVYVAPDHRMFGHPAPPAPSIRTPPAGTPAYPYGGAPTAERLEALERKVAAQEQWIKENTQSPNWSVPMSIAEDEAYGPEGRDLVRRVLAGPPR